MATYELPVSGLLKLGRPEGRAGDGSYPPYELGPEHIRELIRLLHDEELATSQDPEWYSQMHAWRALGQLRAEAAIEPLLDLLAGQDGEDWSDWVTEEVPNVLGMIGPVAIAPTVARLEKRGSQEWPPIYFARTLTEIAKRHPETRDEVVRQLCRVLQTPVMNDPGVNGSVIGNLLDLKATEAWPVVEKAFESDNVDLMVAGDAAEVKYELGLGPKPPDRAPMRFLPPVRPGNAKQRFEERQRKKKLEKKAQKKKRKGK
jgi:hypothetical protein